MPAHTTTVQGVTHREYNHHPPCLRGLGCQPTHHPLPPSLVTYSSAKHAAPVSFRHFGATPQP